MPQTRQLAAILFADIVGFTRLMQENEQKANLARKKLYSSLEAQVTLRQGKILKFSGDGVLCMFQSPVEAVRAAIVVQSDMRQDPTVPLRIGIHQGDVIIDDNDIFGDGVNLASRLESFAVAGSIFISGKVQDEIKNQSDIQSKSLGKYSFKNVTDPNHIYAISNEGLNIPSSKSLEGKGGKLEGQKNKGIISLGILAGLILSYFAYRYFNQNTNAGKSIKSIAVLPFTNLTGDTSTPIYFIEGVTEDILNQLSKITDLKVKSSQASFAYRNSDLSIKQMGENLNVKTILKGSIQRQGDVLRCRANLIDCASEEIIWSEQYDRKMDDIFTVQSDIALQISTKLKANLSEKEKSQVTSIPTQNTIAYESYLQARALFKGFATKEDMENALKLLDRAIRLDLKFSEAYVLKGAYFHNMAGHGMPYPKWKDSAKYYYNRAFEINPQKVEALISLYYLDLDRKFLDQAYAINPNEKAIRAELGWLKWQDGDTTGIAWVLSANTDDIRMDDPNSNRTLGSFYRYSKDYKTAEYYFLKQLALDTTSISNYNNLINLYNSSNEKSKLLDVARKVYQINNPKNSWIIDRMHWAYLVNGKLDSAETVLLQNFELEKKFEDQTQKLPVRHRLGFIRHMLGKKEEGIKLIQEEYQNSSDIINNKRGMGVWELNFGGPYYDLMCVSSFQGKTQDALRYMDSSQHYKFSWDWGYRNDPMLANIRKEPKFINYINYINDKENRIAMALNRELRDFEKENNIPYPPKDMKN